MIRVSGHFGEWLQGRMGPDGPVALVTVPCSALFVEVERLGGGPLRIDQEPSILGCEQAATMISEVGAETGHFRLTANIIPGGGAGASTAALLALARAAGAAGQEHGAACLAAEGASDPLMHSKPDRVLWASREGRVLQDLPPLPLAEIVGGFWGAPERTDAGDQNFDDISDLVAQVSPELPLEALAELASTSAARNSARRGPADDPTADLARSLGALGHVRAHTGSARGLVFAPGTAPWHAPDVLAEAGFANVLSFRTGGPE